MHDVAGIAFAALGPPSGSGPNAAIPQILFVGALFAIFYFLLIRPQQKQRKERERMLESVKKGDRVVTSGGLHGTVVNLNEQTVVLRVADQVKLEFDRTAVARVVEGERGKDA